jgi:hypothetical protein
MSYYDKYIKYKKKYLSFANKISGGGNKNEENKPQEETHEKEHEKELNVAGNDAGNGAGNGAGNDEEKEENQELNALLAPVMKQDFKKSNVVEFMNYFKDNNNISANTRQLVDILNNINSVVNFIVNHDSLATTFTTSQSNDENNVNYNQLWNLTLALYNNIHRILFNQPITQNDTLLITNMINQLITPEAINRLTTVEKYLLGGLRSLYNKLNKRLLTKPTQGHPPSGSTPAPAQASAPALEQAKSLEQGPPSEPPSGPPSEPPSGPPSGPPSEPSQ